MTGGQCHFLKSTGDVGDPLIEGPESTKGWVPGLGGEARSTGELSG